MGKYSANGLGLTIAPTLNCNFQCPYCYEVSQPELMGIDIQEGILDFVRENAGNIRRLSINWYGGEPLIGAGIINKLSKEIINICSQNKIDYSAHMITNGYLFTDDIINTMKENLISGCQITLDGPPEIHNKRRVLRDGNGTFDVILGNIKNLVDKDIHVSIRVNIDKTNIDYVEELLNILCIHELKGVNVNFGQLTAYTEACTSIAGNCFNTKEYSEAYRKLQKLLIKYGFSAVDYPNYPGVKNNYCCADQVNAFVIDPKGFMYKCWNSIGNVDEAVGNVLNIKNPESGWIMRNIEWVSTDPFEGKCLECKFLPICMGGCPYLKREKKEVECEKWQYGFEELLKYMYQIQEKGLIEIPV